MQKILKKYSGIIYIAVMTAVVIVVLNCTNEMEQIMAALNALRDGWVWAAAGCIALYLFLRMATLKFYLHRRGYRISWPEAAGVTGAGQFYSAITPSASGGQPMQIYWLHRMGVPVSMGTACVSVKFLGFQAAVLLQGGLLWAINSEAAGAQLQGLRWLVALGFVINSGLLTLILLTIPKSKLVDRLLSWATAFGAKLRIVKRPDEALESARRMLREYRDALVQLLRAPADAAVVLVLSIVQMASYMAVAVCLYHAFGLSGTGAGEIMTMQFLLFIAAAFVPLPGAAGAQESGFCIFFRDIFPDGNLTAAMVCWRFFSYYVLLISGAAMMAVSKLHRRKE